MTDRRISKDATITDVLSYLGDKDGYVRNVRHKMLQLAKEHGPVVVRIGITGTGTRPSYRVDRADRTPLVAFDAQNHTPFTDVSVDGGQNWSDAVMTFQEVENLLRSIIKRS